MHDRPSWSDEMSLAARIGDEVEQVHKWARFLEDREQRRTGANLPEARLVVARRAAVAPGTLENARKRRLKSPAKWLWDRLRSAVIRELEAEVRHLEHELQIILSTGSDPRGAEMEEVRAGIAQARSALGIDAARRTGR